MALGAGDILVAGRTNLFVAQAAKNFSVFEEHVLWVREIMTGAIIAESLPVTDKAVLLICICDIAMSDGPAEILVTGRRLANDHRRFDDQIALATDDRHRMAQVAFDTD